MRSRSETSSPRVGLYLMVMRQKPVALHAHRSLISWASMTWVPAPAKDQSRRTNRRLPTIAQRRDKSAVAVGQCLGSWSRARRISGRPWWISARNNGKSGTRSMNRKGHRSSIRMREHMDDTNDGLSRHREP